MTPSSSDVINRHNEQVESSELALRETITEG